MQSTDDGFPSCLQLKGVACRACKVVLSGSIALAPWCFSCDGLQDWCPSVGRACQQAVGYFTPVFTHLVPEDSSPVVTRERRDGRFNLALAVATCKTNKDCAALVQTGLRTMSVTLNENISTEFSTHFRSLWLVNVLYHAISNGSSSARHRLNRRSVFVFHKSPLSFDADTLLASRTTTGVLESLLYKAKPCSSMLRVFLAWSDGMVDLTVVEVIRFVLRTNQGRHTMCLNTATSDADLRGRLVRALSTCSAGELANM